MTEQDSSGRAPRPRPSYGLPGPAPAPAPTPTAPSEDDSPRATTPLPPPQFSGQGQAPTRRRRRGLIPLLLGLLGMFVLAPAALIIGIIIAFSGLTSQVMDGPTALENGTVTVPANAGEMYLVYVPEASADSATCTAKGSSADAVTAVPSSSTVTFPDGSKYRQTMGAMAIHDTKVTISCEGIPEGQAAYLGPVSAQQLGIPLLLGAVISVVLGVIGLVLVIIGILGLVRSRRS